MKALALTAVVLLFPGPAHAELGIASVYSTRGPEGTVVACPGRKLDDSALTAAHKTLPCGSRVLVRNKRNGRTVTVTIIDRGPFIAGRIIDLTPAAARAIGCDGLCGVRITKL